MVSDLIHYTSRADMKRKWSEPHESRPRAPPQTQTAIRIRRSIAELGEPGQVAVNDAISELTTELLGTEPENWGSVLEMVKAIAFEQPHKVPFLAILFENVNRHRSAIAEAVADMVRDEISLALENSDALRLKSFLKLASCLTVIEPSSVLTLLEELAQDPEEQVFEALFLSLVYLKLSHPDADTAQLEQQLQKFVDSYVEREGEAGQPLVFSHLVAAAKDALANGWDVSFMPKLDLLGPREPVAPLHRLRAIQVPELKFGPSNALSVELYPATNGVCSVPGAATLFGCVLRDTASCLIENMDFNRKEVTRQLITLDLFFNKDMFCAPATPFDSLQALHDDGAPTIKVEDIAVGAVLEHMLQLPAPQFPAVYYSSILIEACIMAPQAIAPVLGRAVRFLFAKVETLDVRIFWRVVAWFAHHMSNFSFTWKWPEWTQYLDLPAEHPKRVFMQQLVAKQVQLSYAQRVRDVLPDEFLDLVPNIPETPEFEFKDDPVAQRLLEDLESRPSEAVSEARSSIQDQYLGKEASEATTQFNRVVTTVVCDIGNRSLTHASRIINRVADTLQGQLVEAEAIDAVLKYWAATPWLGLRVLEKFVEAGLVKSEAVAARVLSDKQLLLSAAGYDYLVAHKEAARDQLELLPRGDEWLDFWSDRVEKVLKD